MFGKILIANRGEIACRIAATARRLGIATVAVHSEADAGARHVALADEAVAIGPAAAARSYLKIDRIVDAARRTGAEAIHPGYGFLSENPDFVEAVEAAGLVFIGPPAAAIRSMGLKDAAKRLMVKAGVPVVPGWRGDDADPDILAAEAKRIGYPVLIKARAGGGGKGMRKVERPEDFRAALESAQREGQASFGDPVCLVEKYVSRSRHVEIQIFADGHGSVVHLFERDCSLQRRHQKVIEEAPAPGMSFAVRAAMGAAAVEAARAIGYRGAGTVEFIADGARGLRPDGFWFMEMNTRLQVEHPVTEAITGLDLVELQVRVAAGEPLPFGQNDLAIAGHAFEARVYAEDATKGFLPAIGRLEHLAMPPAVEFKRGPVRIDAGVRPGDEITSHYDPMIAKLIVHGPTRTAALNRLAGSLAAMEVAGAVTNLAFLGALARHDGFAVGDVDTDLIGRDLDVLVAPPPDDDRATALACIAALGLLDPVAGDDPWDRLIGFRLWGDAILPVRLERDGTVIDRTVAPLGGRRFRVEGGTQTLDLVIDPHGDGRVRLECDGHGADARVVTVGRRGGPARLTVFLDGIARGFQLPDPLAERDETATTGDRIVAPMPGQVFRLDTEVGAAVQQGDPLVVLAAMKMEYSLAAPRDGTVADVLVDQGDLVAEGAVLLVLAEEASDG